MAITPPDPLPPLRAELQALNPGVFEKLVAALIGRMIGVPVVVAKSGFQHGADAGTAGREDRRLRVETKRYADGTSLGDRELLGELEQATQRDPALELWILAATVAASEQLEDSLFKSALKQGVPALVVDWKTTDGLPTLATLCASAPDVVRELANDRCASLAKAVAAEDARAAESAASLRRALASWNVGYASTAASARDWLERLWRTPADAVAALGQDAAGGAEPTLIRRPQVSRRLDEWYKGAPLSSPAVLVGDEGMGKTWAGVGWLVDNADALPVTLIVPSGMVSAATASATGVAQMIGARLHEVTAVRDTAFWTARLDRMLRRPAEEGPALLLMLDGMNQEPRAPWEAIHRILQASPFAGRVRVVSSTRPRSFETDLRHLSRLVVSPVRIDVGPYDDAPGQEFEQALALRGLRSSDLRDELVPLARVPRLLELVVRLRNRLADLGRVTVHGLLWEYGRDTLGVRGGRSFDEQEWRGWLAEAAERFRTTGTTHLSRRDLENTASRPSLEAREVQQRLSDIVDGHVADPDGLGGATMRPAIVAQALGVAIIADLEAGPVTTAAVTASLDHWLDPISGLMERSEILRAAVAIGAAPGSGVALPVSDALTAAWLATQNLPDDHRRDIAALAPAIVHELLSAVEKLRGQPLASARDIAIEAVRSIPRSDTAARARVADVTAGWMRTVSRDADDRQSRSEAGENARADRLASRVGADADGERMVLGLPLEFVSSTNGHALAFAPSLIEGYPLASFVDLLEAAALQLAIRTRSDVWSSLGWLTLLNETDHAATADVLRARAAEVLVRDVEPGVEPRLRDRVAALLLWLTADPADEAAAKAADPRLDAFHDYEADYEADPLTSMFALERRHAWLVIEDATTTIGKRVRRLEGHWWDPDLPITVDFRAEVEAMADQFEKERLSPGCSTSADDLDLNRLNAAVAVCSPKALARLVRRRIAALAEIEGGRSQLEAGAYESLLVGDEETARVLEGASRIHAAGGGGADDDGTSQLLMQPQLVDMEAEEQVEMIMAKMPASLFTDVNPFLRQLDAAAADRLVQRHRGSSLRATELLVELLSVMVDDIGDRTFRWLEALASDLEFSRRTAAYETLARCRPVDFGSALLQTDWTWAAAGDEYLAHYGSLALLKASFGSPFETIAPRLAPWLVARASRERGSSPHEVRIAAEIVARVVSLRNVEPPEPTAELSVDERRRASSPFALTITTGAGRGMGEIDRFNASMDEEARERASKLAVEEALAHVRTARTAGASLYVASIEACDIAPMLEHAADIVERWCDGAAEGSAAFKRRVRLAEGLFIALVEATMRVDRSRAVPLWKAVRSALITKFIGAAGIDRMILILLAAPADAGIEDVVGSLVSPGSSTTDETIMQVSVAAAAAGRADLLLALADEDRRSGVAWRRERGKALEAFAPGKGAPPAARDGRGTVTEVRDSVWRERRYRDAAAHHWWDRYWSASDGPTAFACWTLFVASVDRRAIEWSRRLWPTDVPATSLDRRKRIYALWQRDELRRAAEKQDKDLARTLYQRRIVSDIKPWTQFAPVNAA